LTAIVGSAIELECKGIRDCGQTPTWYYHETEVTPSSPFLDYATRNWRYRTLKGGCYLLKEVAEMSDEGRYRCNLLENGETLLLIMIGQ